MATTATGLVTSPLHAARVDFRFYRWSAFLFAEAGRVVLHARRTRQMLETGNLGERCDSGANACMVKPGSAEQDFAV